MARLIPGNSKKNRRDWILANGSKSLNKDCVENKQKIETAKFWQSSDDRLVYSFSTN